MYKKIIGAMVLVFGLALAVSASAAGPGPLTCFDGVSDATIYGGHCTITGGTATLDNTGGDIDGSYSGVYYPDDSLKGATLASINSLSFNYTGTATAGSPRISLPIDTNNDGTTDFYAFIGAYYCNDGAGNVMPLTDATCTIFAGSENFINWAALLAAHPDWKVGNDATFIIADDAGSWTVSNVIIGAPHVTPPTSNVPTSKDQCKDNGYKSYTDANGKAFKNQGQCVSYTNHS